MMPECLNSQEKIPIIRFDGLKINYDITDKIGFLTEERSLLTKLTVSEQLIYYGVLKSMSFEEIEKKMDYWLDKFGISDYKNKKIKGLSKQRFLYCD